MSTNADYDRTQVVDAKVVGGTIENAFVDDGGFLVLVIKPKGARTKRVLLTISQDHEGNGPGAAMVDTVTVPRGSRVDREPDGAIVITNRPTLVRTTQKNGAELPIDDCNTLGQAVGRVLVSCYEMSIRDAFYATKDAPPALGLGGSADRGRAFETAATIVGAL